MPNPNLDAYEDLPERNRDPGADLDAEGIPDIASDQQPEHVDDPERVSVPTEEPVVSTSWGTTAEEVEEGEGLERKLAREEPDVDGYAQLDDGGGDPQDEPRDGRPAEEAAMRVVEEP